jgi:hypothetical protein
LANYRKRSTFSGSIGYFFLIEDINLRMRNRKLRMGMIGGGINAFIGSIHRCAALMDNKIVLICEMDGKWQPWID